ncbi:glycosyltransferase [Streptomyces olivochromogenes]|uniref:glycosyltransferase n=1 Tax=Streptomyces olivochromogenes TaxID=1963 RepID=UPI001F32EA94|nr:glycosyltransferase [Streptomyces olivochromogenes]MCF3130208.1 glycosyltransferase [Streptomyces olivochromogenes]
MAFHAQSTVEVPEPLWLREFPRTAVVALSAKLGGVIRRKQVRVVSYAIENSEFSELVGNVPCRRFVRLVLSAFLKLYLRYAVDFVVFGTPGAQRAYAAVWPRAERYPVILELPASRGGRTRARQGLVFLGETSPRKGVDVAMSSWELLEVEFPDAVFSIAGTGPLDDAITRWCRANPGQRRFLGLLRHEEALELIGSALVLVAPSVREKRWREQVGLPISEALSLGLTVVTTDETGLAGYLSSRGHQVVRSEMLSPQSLAAAMSAALASPLPMSRVSGDLPAIHGRHRSHEVLHGGSGD